MKIWNHMIYLPKMVEYVVSGNAQIKSSWHKTNNVYKGQEVEKKYILGQQIDFKTTSPIVGDYLETGFSNPEKTHIWTDDKIAQMFIPIKDGKNKKNVWQVRPSGKIFPQGN